MRQSPSPIETKYEFSENGILPPILSYDVRFPETQVHLEWKLSNHGKQRSIERNIPYEHIVMAIEYGVEFFKQNRIFYVVTSKSLPDQIESRLRNHLENLVVVVSKEGSVITCYKAKNGIKHIKLKSKRLRKNYSYTKTEHFTNNLAA